MTRSPRRALRHLALLAGAAAALASGPPAAAPGSGPPAAVARDGAPTVMSWGSGRTGQLGNGTLTDSLSPTSVTGLPRARVEQISAGGTASADSFALARAGGTVTAWGRNSAGQLGTGDHGNHTVPAAVPRLTNIKDIAAGGRHALALDTGGRVYSWGDNRYGQLGDNRTGDSRTLPDRVAGMPGARQISAGCDFSLALLENGEVYAWGRGNLGQLGTGDRATSSVPRRVVGLKDIVRIDAGCHHALALTADGTVKSWGDNLYGQLGDSSIRSSTRPVDVDRLREVIDIEAGAYHNYAQTKDGHVWGWGNNQYGQLLEEDESSGATVLGVNRTAPVEIPRLLGALDLAAGARHGVAVSADGDVLTWGHNGEGQLGNGTTESRFRDVRIAQEVSAIKSAAVSLGGNTSYAY
ncbi:RCC1-like domain-containing protein [Streptomyces echinatus]|uniref:RCC1-like domain-containing protein n=1 Tax=Streptomyces echinatus TaxID=67293 RepID=UPI00382EB08B